MQTEYYATTSDQPGATLVHVCIYYEFEHWYADLGVPGEDQARSLTSYGLPSLLTMIEEELDNIMIEKELDNIE